MSILGDMVRGAAAFRADVGGAQSAISDYWYSPRAWGSSTGGSAFTPLSFSFSDGVQTINSANATYEQFIDFDPNLVGGFADYSVTLYAGANHIALEYLGTGLEYDTVAFGSGIGRVGEAGSFALPSST